MTRACGKGGVQAGGTIFLLFVAVFLTGITLTADGFIGWAALRQIQALGYLTAVGTITHSAVIEDGRGHSGSIYRPDIRYTYSVAGKLYNGDRYRYGQISASGRFADRIVALYPVGRQVEVHYASSAPADAVLRVGLEGVDLFLPMFMLPFNLLMLALWIGGIRYRFFPPAAGGAKVWNDGRYLRVRLSPWRPFSTGAIVVGFLAFASAFVIVFGFGWNPSIEVPLIGWGLILGGGGMSYLYAMRKWCRGDSDLMIDGFAQSVTLPQTFGRQENIVVPLEKMVSLELERVEKPGARGNSRHCYIPTLIFTDSDGSQRREELIELWDEPSAKRLVEWLYKRLRVGPSS